jgi:hypothetical protein
MAVFGAAGKALLKTKPAFFFNMAPVLLLLSRSCYSQNLQGSFTTQRDRVGEAVFPIFNSKRRRTMKTTLKLMMVLMLTFAVAAACSQNKGTDEQAQSTTQKETATATKPQAADTVGEQNQAPAAGHEQMNTPAPAAGQEQMNTPAAPQQMDKTTEQKSSSQETSSVQPKMSEVSGTLVKTDEGIRLFSDSGNYIVAGQDLSGMVGRKVKVTGTIEENAGKPVINLSSVSIIE